jgi:hypothetical protein
MPDLFVVQEFKRRCLNLLGSKPVRTQLYFNPKDFRHGGHKSHHTKNRRYYLLSRPLILIDCGRNAVQDSILYEDEAAELLLKQVQSSKNDYCYPAVLSPLMCTVYRPT